MRTRLALAAAVTVFALARAADAQSAGGGAGARPAGGAAAAGGGAAGGAAPSGPRQASPGRQALQRAMVAYVARDYDTAMAAFREAGQQAAERAEAKIGEGYVLAARGDRDGAVRAWREAIQASMGAADAMNRVRATQAIANHYESVGQWNDAITAWQDLASFAEQSGNRPGDAANARARIEAIRAREGREGQNAQVRQRIEQRRAANARAPQQQP